MSSDILDAMKISAMGMKVQGTRLRVTTENVANADTTGLTPGSEPYHRKTITFKDHMDKQSGIDLVQVNKITEDKNTPFPMKYMPDSPAANAQGMVKMPNVNALIEIMDVREAQRSYEANLGMIDQAKSMAMRTIDMIRA